MSSSISYPTHVAALKPYVPGLPIAAAAARSGIAQDRIVKLASNENPLGASPRALAALSGAAIDLSRYPDSDCAALSAAIAAFHDVPRDWIVVGAGSESVLGNLVSTLLQPGRSTAYSQYSFQAYVNAAQKLGATSTVVASPDFRVDLEGLAAAIQPSTALVYIANPGNPTGTVVGPDGLEAFLGRVPAQVVVLLDEAYFEFMPAALRGDSIAWVRRHPNLVGAARHHRAAGGLLRTGRVGSHQHRHAGRDRPVPGRPVALSPAWRRIPGCFMALSRAAANRAISSGGVPADNESFYGDS